jgi:hypothetical protein
VAATFTAVAVTFALAAVSVALTAVSMTVTLAAVPVTVAFMAVIALAIVAGVGRGRRRSPRPLASAGVGAIRIVAAPAVGEPAGATFLAVPGDFRCDLRRIFQADRSRMCIIGKVLRERMGLRSGRHAKGDGRRGSKRCKEAFHGIS